MTDETDDEIQTVSTISRAPAVVDLEGMRTLDVTILIHTASADEPARAGTLSGWIYRNAVPETLRLSADAVSSEAAALATAAAQILESHPDLCDVLMVDDIVVREGFRDRVAMSRVFDGLVSDLQVQEDGTIIVVRPEPLLPHGEARRAEYMAAVMEPWDGGPVWWRPSIV